MLMYLAFANDESVDIVERTPLQAVKCGFDFCFGFVVSLA